MTRDLFGGRSASGLFGNLRVATMLVAVAAAPGCGPGGPAVAFVEGVVLLDGSPVDGATVSFSPRGAGGLPAIGKTDASGRFHLTSTRGGRPDAGAVVGLYYVAITKVEYDLGGRPAPADGDYSGVPVRHRVPESYASGTSSGLTADVVAGRNTVRFDLVSKSGRSP